MNMKERYSSHSNEILMDSEDIPYLLNLIRSKEIWFERLELEYRHSKKSLLVRFEGHQSMKLSSSYLKLIQSQIVHLNENILMPLINKYKQNFILNVSVDQKGNFSFSNLNLTLKINCPNTIINEMAFFDTPLRLLLPFAADIHTLVMVGFMNKPAYLEAFLQITDEDLLQTIEEPITHPKIRAQWESHMSTVYYKMREENRYIVKIPILDGKIVWDNKIETIQYAFNLAELRKKSM